MAKKNQKANEKNILFHNEWIKQLKLLNDAYKDTLGRKGICLEWCICCCECGDARHIANKIARCESLKNKIKNLKCRCGCNS